MSKIGWEYPEDVKEQVEYEAGAGLRGRLFFMRMTVVSVLGFMLIYVVWIQQFRGEELAKTAEQQRFATIKTDATRGVIFDRDGEPLAENVPSFNVRITPNDLPSDAAARQAVFERLSLLTGVPVTNTVAQEALVRGADAQTVAETNRLASLYGTSALETLDLAQIVDELPDSIEEIVDTYDFLPFSPAVITSSVPISLARVVEQESVYMPGVTVATEAIRNYPTGEFTANLLGFMGPLPDRSYITDLGYQSDDRVGLFGLESSMESFLQGEKGERSIEVNALGEEVRQIGETTQPTAGYNLHLTLDSRLQEATHQIMEDVMQKKRDSDSFVEYPEVEQAVVVALNPKNGEVLAMVNLPTFDNNRFATEIDVQYYLQLARDEYQPLFNNAIGGQYPPGSVFKILTGAAALQENIISPNRQLDAPGEILIQNRFAPNDPGRAQRFVCWVWNVYEDTNGDGVPDSRGKHGAMNMYRALAESCDIYFYKVAGGFDQDNEFVDALGIERLRRYGLEFGFGDIQGIELPAEAPGLMPSKEWLSINLAQQWATGDDYNAAIGQGYVLVTPLQVAQMMAVVANGGFLYQPTIIHHMTNADGDVVIFDENDNPLIVQQGANGQAIVQDEKGNYLDPAALNMSINFDAEGNYIRPPELIRQTSVSRENLQVIAEGLRQANDEGGTGGAIGVQDPTTSAIIPWFDSVGIETAGKSGTAEYCDNIAQRRGWCAQPDSGIVQPTHAWYVGYAPFDDPEIVVTAFIFNGGEGSAWAGPIVRDVMELYFGLSK